jgi:SAM-dependent methyltransferase
MNAVPSEDTVYADPRYREIDVGSLMRTGHPDIAEGDDYILSVVAAARRELGRPLHIIDIGSGSGDLSLMIARSLSDCTVVANDVAPNPVAQARSKLAPYANASVFDGQFEDWVEPVDIAISWGSHHHLSHRYLHHARDILGPHGLLIIGDEFCPEYITGDDADRLARAAEITVLDGYVFDNPEDIGTYRATGRVPDWSLRLEEARRRALWTWYKFVGDYAVEHHAWPVVIAELGIARDDLTTEEADEHKTSPRLLERELTLNGFDIAGKSVIGERDAALLSFVIYTCRPATAETHQAQA